MDFEQPVRDVNSVIRVDPDQVGVEGGMVDFDSGRRSIVNAGEKMYRRAGVKLHHGWTPNAPGKAFAARQTE